MGRVRCPSGLVAFRTSPPTTSNVTDARLFISPDGQGWVPWDGAARPGVRWYALHRPTANTQASVTVPAPGLGFCLIAESITVTLVGGSSAPSAASVNVSLINGGSGGSDYRWGTVLGIAAVAGATSGAVVNADFSGSENTGLTLEFSANAGANTLESVAFHGRVATI